MSTPDTLQPLKDAAANLKTNSIDIELRITDFQGDVSMPLWYSDIYKNGEFYFMRKLPTRN